MKRAGLREILEARCALLVSQIAIVARPGRAPVVRGRLPRSKAAEIESFFARDLRPSRPVRVRGSWGRDGALRLRIAGRLAAGDRQRVRNFLVDLLG